MIHNKFIFSFLLTFCIIIKSFSCDCYSSLSVSESALACEGLVMSIKKISINESRFYSVRVKVKNILKGNNKLKIM
jgi:hypothetical protein